MDPLLICDLGQEPFVGWTSAEDLHTRFGYENLLFELHTFISARRTVRFEHGHFA